MGEPAEDTEWVDVGDDAEDVDDWVDVENGGRPGGKTLADLLAEMRREADPRYGDAEIDTIDGRPAAEVRAEEAADKNYFLRGVANPFNIQQLMGRHFGDLSDVQRAELRRIIEQDAREGGIKYGLGQGVAETAATAMLPGGGVGRGLAQAGSEGAISELNRSGWEADNAGRAVASGALSMGTDLGMRAVAGAAGGLARRAGREIPNIRPDAPTPRQRAEASDYALRRLGEAVDNLDPEPSSIVPEGTAYDFIRRLDDAMPPASPRGPSPSALVESAAQADPFRPSQAIIDEARSWPKEASEYARVLMSDDVLRKTGKENPYRQNPGLAAFLDMSPAQRAEFLRSRIGDSSGASSSTTMPGGRAASRSAPNESGARTIADTMVDSIPPGAATMPPSPTRGATTVKPALQIEGVEGLRPRRVLGELDIQPGASSAPRRPMPPLIDYGMDPKTAAEISLRTFGNRLLKPESAVTMLRNVVESEPTQTWQNIVTAGDMFSSTASAQYTPPTYSQAIAEQEAPTPLDDTRDEAFDALVEAYDSPALQSYPGLAQELADMLHGWTMGETPDPSAVALMEYRLSDVPGLRWSEIDRLRARDEDEEMEP